MKIHKVLLTGGGGLTGRLLAQALRSRYDLRHLEVADPNDGLPCVQADLRDLKAVTDACAGIDAILHVAALHGAAWQKAGDVVGFDVNVTGTKNILEAARLTGVKRVVFTSSIWANGHGDPAPAYLPIDEVMDRVPSELYGLTKILGETMCRYATIKYGFSTIVLRPGGIARAEAYDPANGRYLAGSVDVRDVVTAHALALAAPESVRHGVFNITADSPLCKVDPARFKQDPAGALESVVPGAMKLVKAGRLQLAPGMEWYSIAAAKRVLGYRPEFNFRLD
jgi:nucleoside-diphosphate-sugar epimerase